MLTRRGFIVTGICSAVAKTSIASGINCTSTLLNDSCHEEQIQDLNNLSYKTLEMQKGNTLRLHDGEMTINVKIADVHNMNSDYRLEQFSLLVEPTDNTVDISGVYQAQLSSESGTVDFPVSIIGNQADSNESKYLAVFSRIKTV